jgi:hypothetical protein
MWVHDFVLANPHGFNIDSLAGCDTTPHMGEQDMCADSELSAFLGSVLPEMGCLMVTEIMEP